MQAPSFRLGLIVVAACGLTSAGCTAIDRLPAGAQLQSSTFGLRISPQSLDGTPFVLGSHTVVLTTSQPTDAGPNLNRFEAIAPGLRLKTTVATGPVGEQLKAAGGVPAIQALVAAPKETSKAEPDD